MDQAQVYRRLEEIFRDVFDDDSIQVTSDLSAEKVDGWDSVAHIRLILTVEKAFNMRFTTAEIGKLRNVGDLAQLIEARS